MTVPITAHAVALSLIVCDMALRGLKARVLLGPSERAGLLQLVAVNAYGEAASAITPARLGGEPARFLGLKQLGIATPKAAVMLGTERIVDYVLLGTVTVVAAVTVGDVALRGAGHLATRIATPIGLVAVVAVLIAAAVSMRWLHRSLSRIPTPLIESLRHMRTEIRTIRPAAIGATAGLTALSMTARTAVLPVLLLGHPGLSPAAVVLGSFALLYGQLLMPTPAGAGAVELGFAAGMSGLLDPAAIIVVLLTWRFYTLVIGASLGTVLAASRGLTHLGRLRGRPPRRS